MLVLGAFVAAFAPPGTPLRSGVSLQKPWTTAMPLSPAAIGSALAAFPTAAIADDGGGIVDGIVNLVLTGFVLAFVAFIGIYVKDAIVEVGDTVQGRIEYNKANPGQKQAVATKEAIYDDTGSGAVSDDQIRKEIKYREEKGAGSKQVLGGKRVAPWMNIDEDMVKKYKAKKDAERKKRQEDLYGR